MCDGREDPEDQHWEQEEDDELEDSLDEIHDSLEEGDEDYESDEEHKPILGKNVIQSTFCLGLSQACI